MSDEKPKNPQEIPLRSILKDRTFWVAFDELSRGPLRDERLIKAIHEESILAAEDLEAAQRNLEDAQAKLKNQHDKLQDARHKHRHATLAAVISDWLEDTSRWPSAPKAAAHYCATIAPEYTTKTVADWIRECAKEKGIRLR